MKNLVNDSTILNFVLSSIKVAKIRPRSGYITDRDDGNYTIKSLIVKAAWYLIRIFSSNKHSSIPPIASLI